MYYRKGIVIQMGDWSNPASAVDQTKCCVAVAVSQSTCKLYSAGLIQWYATWTEVECVFRVPAEPCDL